MDYCQWIHMYIVICTYITLRMYGLACTCICVSVFFFQVKKIGRLSYNLHVLCTEYNTIQFTRLQLQMGWGGANEFVKGYGQLLFSLVSIGSKLQQHMYMYSMCVIITQWGLQV